MVIQEGQAFTTVRPWWNLIQSRTMKPSSLVPASKIVMTSTKSPSNQSAKGISNAIPGELSSETIDSISSDKEKKSCDDEQDFEDNGVDRSIEALLGDDDAWMIYESMMRELMTNKRVLKKDKLGDMEPVQQFLLSRPQDETTAKSSLSSPLVYAKSNDNRLYRETLRQRRTEFNATSQWTDKQYDYALRCITYIGDFCAKERTSLPIVVAWYKMKLCGMIPKENCISTFMYVLSINAEGGKCGNHSAEKLNSITNDVLMEVATSHDLLFPPNEKTVTLRIKSLIANHNIQDAERILQSLPDEEQQDGSSKVKKRGSSAAKRLRTFLPILEYYCKVKDINSILRVFQQMKQSRGVHMDVDTYALIISTLAENGSFFENAENLVEVPVGTNGAITSTATSGAGHSFSDYGPELFDQIMNDLAQDMMEISEDAAKIITAAFQNSGKSSTLEEDEIPFLCEEEDVSLLNRGVRAPTVNIGRVRVNDTTAICPVSKSKLRLFALNDMQREHVHDTLLEMAKIQHQEFFQRSTKGKKIAGKKENQDPEYGYKQLKLYSEWLE